jgi:hypothetical protein
MTIEKILFSVNQYDRDGDITESGIFLHFGYLSLFAGNTLNEFKDVIKQLEGIAEELEENYPELIKEK